MIIQVCNFNPLVLIFCNHCLIPASEDKLTSSMDGSKVIPFDILKAELFYPKREENQQTTTLLMKMSTEAATSILQELRDPKKATSDYLTSAGGRFSLGETTDEEHAAMIGIVATNDAAKSPFASLT